MSVISPALAVASPWATKRLDEFGGDLRKFRVVRLMPSTLNQIAISKEKKEDCRRAGEAAIALLKAGIRPRDIITRMLHNLKEVHKTAEDWQRMIPVQDRQIALNPDVWSEYRDRGLAFAELGKATAAVRDFDVYLQNVTDAPDVKAIALRAQELRRAVL